MRTWCLKEMEERGKVRETKAFVLDAGPNVLETCLFQKVDLCGSPSAVKMQWPQAVVAVKSTNFEGVSTYDYDCIVKL